MQLALVRNTITNVNGEYEERRPTEMCNQTFEYPVDLHPHILGFKRIFGYIAGTLNLGIIYESNGEKKLNCFTVANFGV